MPTNPATTTSFHHPDVALDDGLAPCRCQLVPDVPMVFQRDTISSREIMEQPTFEQAITAYLQWAETHQTEAFVKQQERTLRHEVQPIMGKLSMLLVTWKLFNMANSLADSQEKRRLLAIINSANMVMDWVVPRLEDRPLRITLDSMQRTLKDLLYSQELRPQNLRLQMEQLRAQNPSVAPTVERIQKQPPD
jgi:hypothetical protein